MCVIKITVRLCALHFSCDLVIDIDRICELLEFTELKVLLKLDSVLNFLHVTDVIFQILNSVHLCRIIIFNVT